MTRAKGWVHISGLNRPNSFYDEFKLVMEAEGRYKFHFKKAPYRDLSDQDLPPEWSAVTTEVEDKFHPFIFKIADSLEAPVLYHKIIANQKVIARPLLSWPDKKIAITDGKLDMVGLDEWTVFTIQKAARNPSAFVKAFG